MEFWLNRGFKLNGVAGKPGVFIVSRAGKHAVVRDNEWTGALELQSDWFHTPERATIEANDLFANV